MHEPETARAPGPHLGRRLLRALLVLLLCFVAAELTVRVGASRVRGVRLLAEPRGVRTHEPQSFAEFQHAYRDHLEPFRDWRGSRCNSYGFHDVEFRRDLPSGALRVVALGDSFTYGNVRYGRCYLTVAEALLRVANGVDASPLPVEVDNLGVPATGIADYRLVYEFVGRDLSPDVVVVTLYLGNDPRDFADPSRFGAQRRPWSRSWLLTFLQRSAALAAERWRSGAPAAAPVAAPVAAPGPAHAFDEVAEAAEEARPIFSDQAYADILSGELQVLALPHAGLDAPDWGAFRTALAALVDDVERDGARVVLVLAPSRLQVHASELAATAARDGVPLDLVDADLPQREVADFATPRGVALVDLTPALRSAAAAEGVLYHPNDTHWNLRGNAVAGIELAQRLVDLGLVPRATRK